MSCPISDRVIASDVEMILPKELVETVVEVVAGSLIESECEVERETSMGSVVELELDDTTVIGNIPSIGIVLEAEEKRVLESVGCDSDDGKV